MTKSKKKKSNSLKDRMNKSYASKDKGGSNRPQAFDWKKAKNVKFFTPKEGKNKINIVPYRVKSKNDPLVHCGESEIGDESYMLDVWIHTYVGPTQAEVICPKANYGKPCPICKQAQEFKDKGKKDEAANLWPSRFCYYNIIDVKNPEEGLQVLGIKFNKFEKEMIEEARAASDDGDLVDFTDIDDGKMVTFRGAEVTKLINGKSVTYLEFKSFAFPDRDDPLDSDLIDQAISFDELMKLPNAEAIEKTLFGEDDDADDEDDEKPAKKAASKLAKKSSKDDDEDEEEDDEDDEDEDEDDEDEDEDDDEDDEDEDEGDDDEDEEDDEADEDEEPIKKSTKAPAKKPAPAKKSAPEKAPVKGAKNPCPHKHKFGVDNDATDDCEDCDLWADCLKEKNRLKKAK